MTQLDTEDYEKLGSTFQIARQLAQETMYENDEGCPWRSTPEQRWAAVRAWALRQLRPETLVPAPEPPVTRQ